METASVVDLVDEPRKVLGDIGEGFVGHRIDGFDLEGLHEALGLGVVVGVASAPHRSDETAAKQGFPIGLSGILRTAIRVVNAAGRRPAALEAARAEAVRADGRRRRYLRRYCTVDSDEERLLGRATAPMVLLNADGPKRLPEEISPGLGALGFMLPTTPCTRSCSGGSIGRW